MLPCCLQLREHEVQLAADTLRNKAQSLERALAASQAEVAAAAVTMHELAEEVQGLEG